MANARLIMERLSLMPIGDGYMIKPAEAIPIATMAIAGT
jgi:hypothetical protein